MTNTEKREAEFCSILKPFMDVRELYQFLKWNGYFKVPASLNHHGDYEGGLFDHSKEVAMILSDWTDKLDLKWNNERSPLIIGLLHDVCKMDDYTSIHEIDSTYKIKLPDEYIYNNDNLLPGHAEKSLIMIQPYIRLTEEETLCIRYHMGAYEGEKLWQYFNKALKKYPNVLYTHTADMVASQIKNV